MTASKSMRKRTRRKKRRAATFIRINGWGIRYVGYTIGDRWRQPLYELNPAGDGARQYPILTEMALEASYAEVSKWPLVKAIPVQWDWWSEPHRNTSPGFNKQYTLEDWNRLPSRASIL